LLFSYLLDIQEIIAFVALGIALAPKVKNSFQKLLKIVAVETARHSAI
jgi:hypothetical protein